MSFILLGILNSQAAGAVGGGSYDLLETTVLGSSQSSVSFTSLNSTYGTDYKHLQIRYVARSDRAANVDSVLATFNGDSTTSYAHHRLVGDGSSVLSQAITSDTSGRFGIVTASNFPASDFAPNVYDILDFANTSKNTTARGLGGVVGTDNELKLESIGFFKTDAIDSISLEPDAGTNFVTGSRFSLYGIGTPELAGA